MRIGREKIMSVFFTAWGYGVTYLEFASVIASFVAVTLGALGKRVAWPWWVLSSTLYGVFFYQVDLFASALLQIVFIAAAVWGWFGWKSTGAQPSYMSNKERGIWAVALVAMWLVSAPILSDIGAAASRPDSFLLVSSTIAQIVMVLQRHEAWSLWIGINIFATYHYSNQEYWFTAVLYLALTVLAVFGWFSWRKLQRNNR
jgi:nicotinamide mononucleotide transporter